MSSRRGTSVWISGVVGLAVVAGVAAVVTVVARGRRGSEPPARTAAVGEQTALPALAAALREGDARALAVLYQRTAVKPDAPALPALTDAEAVEWVDVLKGVRTGFLKFGTYGRSSALTVAGRVLQRFSADPAPNRWVEVLHPVHDLLSSGLADGSLDVRGAALLEISKVWGWLPGRAMLPAEEDVLSDWKQGFCGPVVRRLGDREPSARAAAVACLGQLPLTDVAAQAVAYLEDPASPEVRKQVLVSFARRPALLTEDAVLKHMYDPDRGVAETAELVLKARGLSQEQISLGSMIFHPKPEIRASVIPLLKEQTDLDPVVWLIQLSRDADESVRMGAVEALAARVTPEVGQRLSEMAATDKSPAVRRAATRLLPAGHKTAALPPLPGSPSLNPKAN